MDKNILRPPVLFAWLLRTDVRKSLNLAGEAGQKEFLTWWALSSGPEFGQTPTFNDAEKHILFEPLHGSDDTYYGQCRLSTRLLQIRSDVLQQYLKSIPEKANLLSHAWFYVYGLFEHDLQHLLDKTRLEWLNSKPNFFDQHTANDKTNIDMTWLMYFIWLLRPDLHDRFPLSSLQTRLRFLVWFFLKGVNEFNIEKLISEKWQGWLKSNAILNGQVLDIPRIGLLIWQNDNQLKNNFDLTNRRDQVKFLNWLRSASHKQKLVNYLYAPSQQEQLVSVAVSKKKKFGVNLIGFAFGELGIGEEVRMAASACDAAGIPYVTVNINPGNQVRQKDNYLKSTVVEVSEAIYSINIFCLTGFDTATAYLKYGESLFKGFYNIGWWSWELTVWPEKWLPVFDLMDEIWATTQFTERMYKHYSKKPTYLMSSAVSVARKQHVSRKKLGLPEKKFLFLYIFDFNSYLARKNPWAALKAFKRAFDTQDKNVGLVLKTMNTNQDNPLWKKFCKLCSEDSRIILIQKTLDRGDVLGLVDACDAYVSLHRAEGFGRTMAEALLFGKPVVATNFSGNTDFVNPEIAFPVKYKMIQVKVGEYPFVEESDSPMWADPSISDAAKKMREAKKAAESDEFSKKVKIFAEEKFSPKMVGRNMRARLENIMNSVS